MEDCVDGATVSISKDGHEIGNTQTDAFGDFKIDKFAPNSGTYALSVAAPGKSNKKIEVELHESVYLGTIEI